VINTEKTIAMPFYTSQNKCFLKCEVTFKGMDITYEYETKFLGLHLIEGIKLDIHVKNLRSKLDRSYYIMQSLQVITSVNILRSMHFANFHLHLRYDPFFFGEVTGNVNEFLKYKRKL
jgi:hypothetical protein